MTSSFPLVEVSFRPSCFSTADGMLVGGSLATPGEAAPGAGPAAPGGGGRSTNPDKSGVYSKVKSYLPVRPVLSITGRRSIFANRIAISDEGSPRAVMCAVGLLALRDTITI